MPAIGRRGRRGLPIAPAPRIAGRAGRGPGSTSGSWGCAPTGSAGRGERTARASRPTVVHVLRRPGLGRLPLLAPQPVVRRYERAHPGELVDMEHEGAGPHAGHRPPTHGDRTTRVRGIGWEHVHVCIDDASRLAYSEVLATNKQHDALGFLERAVAWFAARGVRIAGVMTDNGAAYRAWSWAEACTRLGLPRLRTRPYTPRTNGRRKRFIQTLLRGLSGKASPITAHAASILVGDIGRIPIPSIAQNFASQLRTVIRARGQLRTFSKCQRLFEVQYNTIPAGKAESTTHHT